MSTDSTRGARILSLVEANDEQADELAGLLDVPRSALDDLLSGDVDMDVVMAAADVFDVSAAYLACVPGVELEVSASMRLGLADEVQAPREAFEFAELMMRTAAVLDSWQGEKSNALSSLIVDYSWYEREAGKRTAERLRALLDIGDEPITNLVEVLESTGAAVAFRSMPENIVGFTARSSLDGTARQAVVVNCDTNWARQRFTAAHELGHVVYRDEGQIVGGQVIVDVLEEQNSLVEIRANTFARHLLLPVRALHEWVEDGRRTRTSTAKIIARIMVAFGVSRELVIRALVDDEILDEHHPAYAYLAEARVEDLMREAGLQAEWQELVDDEHSPSGSPMLVERAIDAYADGLIHPRVVAELLDRDVQDVTEELNAGRA